MSRWIWKWFVVCSGQRIGVSHRQDTEEEVSIAEENLPKKSSCSTFSKSSFFSLLCFEFSKRSWISASTLTASPSWMRVTLYSSVLQNAQALWTFLVCPMQWSTVRRLWSKFTTHFTKFQCKEVTTGFETNILGHLQSNLYSYQAMHLHVSLNVKTREIWFCQEQ